MRALCGEVTAVQAIATNAIRGYAVEESAAVLLQFANGAVGTMSVSDATVAPWSWETTAGENPDFPKTGESCYRIAGTLGSISIPDLHRLAPGRVAAIGEIRLLSEDGFQLVAEDPLRAPGQALLRGHSRRGDAAS